MVIMIIKIIEIFIFLWFLHALADFTLQSDTMANGKNKKGAYNTWVIKLGRDPKDFDGKVWIYWMSAHALIQGGLLYLIFGNIWLFIIESISHFIIDYLKCKDKTNIHQDQGAHIILRFIYAILIVGGIF